MSWFGVQQVVNLLTPNGVGDPCNKTVQAFKAVTDATTNVLDGSLKEAFKVGDSLQKGMVDLMFGGALAGGLDPNRWARAGGNVLQSLTDVVARAGSRTNTDQTDQHQPSAASTADSPGSNWGPMPS